MPFTIGEPAPNRSKSWSPEDEAMLQEMRSAGSAWSVIAKALGRTQASCEGRYAVLRKRKEPSSKNDAPTSI